MIGKWALRAAMQLEELIASISSEHRIPLQCLVMECSDSVDASIMQFDLDGCLLITSASRGR